MDYRNQSYVTEMSPLQVHIERNFFDSTAHKFASPRHTTHNRRRQSIEWSRCTCGAFPEICYGNGSHGYLGLSFVTIRGFTLHLRPPLLKWSYGRSPPRLLSYCPGSSKLEAVDNELLSRDQTLDIRSQLLQAQNHMKSQHDQSHREVHFQVGDMVLLRLQNHKIQQKTITTVLWPVRSCGSHW